MTKLNKQSKFLMGFSFVEMLVVLAILTMLISIIVSSFSKVGGSESLEVTLTSVISVLNEAKSQAVSSRDASDYGVRILNNKLIYEFQINSHCYFCFYNHQRSSGLNQ